MEMKATLTIEESAQLIELGVDKKLAGIVSANEPYYPDDVEFSLGALLSILPKKITDRRHIYELRMGITDCLGGDEHWYVCYKDSRTDMDDLESFVSADELIDAVFLELCWLKQQDNVTEL